MLALSIDLTQRLLNAFAGGGIALLVAWGVSRWSRNPSLTNWIWRLAILRCLIGLLWVSPLYVPLSPQSIQAASNPSQVSTLARQATWEERVVLTAAAPSRDESQPVLREEWVLLFWLAGLLAVGAKEVRRLQRLQTFLSEAEELTGGPHQRLLQQLALEFRLWTVPRLYVTQQAISPLLIGTLRPCLVIPEAILSDENASLLELTLRHELWHIKRRDPIWTGLFNTTRSLLWFQPLLWVANRPWMATQEAACDASLLNAGTPREVYEDALIALLRLCRKAAPRLGLSAVSGATMRHRLLTLNGWRRPSRLQIITLTATLAVVAALGLVPWRPAPAGSVGSFADGTRWPQPIDDVDWSTPKLDSPADSHGFRLLRVQRGQFVSPDALVNAPQLDPFSTGAWIQIPDQVATQEATSHYHLQMVTSAGTCRIRTGILQDSNKLLFSIPVGYPDSVHEADLVLDMDGKQAASWRLTNLPKTPILRAAAPAWITENTAVGVPFMAYAKHVNQRDGNPDWIEFSAYNAGALPTDKFWELQFTGPFFERVATSTFAFGAGGSGIMLVGPTMDGTIQRLVGPNGSMRNSYAFARELSSAALYCNLVGFKSEQFRMSLHHLSLRREANGEVLCANGVDRFDTPLGIPLRISVMLEGLANRPTSGLSFMLGLDRDLAPVELPGSPLARFGKPIRIQIGISGGVMRGGFAQMRQGCIELSAVISNRNLPDHFDIEFNERVDLENHPMHFLVPVAGSAAKP